MKLSLILTTESATTKTLDIIFSCRLLDIPLRISTGNMAVHDVPTDESENSTQKCIYVQTISGGIIGFCLIDDAQFQRLSDMEDKLTSMKPSASLNIIDGDTVTHVLELTETAQKDLLTQEASGEQIVKLVEKLNSQII